MKLECLKNVLLEKISLLQGAVSKNLTLPILNNILIQTENGRIKLAATNLELGMIAWVGGKIIDSGEITVPIKLLINVLSNISSEKIILEVKQNSLVIQGEMSKISIKGMDGKDFPIIPKIEGGTEINLNSDQLKKTISQTIFSVSISETRPELTGIFIELSDKNINFVSTDSFRLAKSAAKFDLINSDSLNIIIPSKTMSEVLKCIGGLDSGSKVLIRISDNQILFSLSNNISIISRIIEGQFPPYKQIIPEKTNTKIFVDKSALIKTVKMAGIFAAGKASEITIRQKDKNKNKIELNSSSQDIGENSSLLEAEIKGDKIDDLVLSYKYLLEGISAVDSDKVCFSINNSNTPITITSGDDKDSEFLYLIMPLR